MFSRIMVGAAMVLTAMAGVLAAPAQANPVAENVGIAADRYVNLSATDFCPEGYFCAWEGADLVGRGVGFFATETNWGAIPSEFRWINNFARSGSNNGTAGALDDVWAYPLPNFGNSSSFPAVCLPNGFENTNWGALRPESNRWVNNC
jgi:hypothetical protein